MARFTAQMEDYLFEIIRTGENGNIYRCLVLRADNQKIKMSPFFLYYIIVAVWEYPFFLSSPIHNSAAVKAKAANWDALRCFATFTLRNRKFFSSKTSLETRRDETRWDETRWDVLRRILRIGVSSFVRFSIRRYGPSSSYTACPRSLDPFYVVTYYINWIKTSHEHWVKWADWHFPSRVK